MIIKRILIILSLLIIAQTCWGESVFSIHGMGESIHPVEPRARAMGGVGIAVNSEYNLGFINPALPSLQKYTSFIGTYMPESRIVKSNDKEGNFTDANFPLLKLVIPAMYDLNFAIGICQVTDSDYMVSDEKIVPNTDITYIEKVAGEGGLYKASVGIARDVFYDLALGAEFNYYFGQKEDAWSKAFDDDDYYDTYDVYTNNMSGIGYSIGLFYQPLKNLSLGMAYNAPPTIDVEKEVTHIFDLPTSEDKEIELPSSFGVGASYDINSQFTVASDFFMTNWGDEFTVTDNVSTQFVNSTRFGIGAEYIYKRASNIAYWHKIAYRLGFYTSDWAYEFPEGKTIQERFLTAGLGVPLKGSGMMDMALEFGLRGNKDENTLEEQVLRFSISLSGQEKWGKRRRVYP